MKTEHCQLADRFEVALDRVIDLARAGEQRWEERAIVMTMYVMLQGRLSEDDVRGLLAEWEEWEEFVKVQSL